MTAPAWMPFYVADYLADTGHLSAVEHGAYLLLIMHYWQRRELPTDDYSLANICRMADVEDWMKIREKILAFFKLANGSWHHKRIDREITIAKKISKARSLAGKAGASARYGKRMAIAMANAVQTDAPIPLHLPLERKKERERGAPNGAHAHSKKATRLSDSWTPSVENIAYAKSKGLGDGPTSREVEKFRDYWIAKAGKDGVKLDWDATWRTWISRTCERAGIAPTGETPAEKAEAQRKRDWEGII